MIILNILLNILNETIYWSLLDERPANGEGVGTGHGLGVSVDNYVGAHNIFFEINTLVTKEYR